MRIINLTSYENKNMEGKIGMINFSSYMNNYERKKSKKNLISLGIIGGKHVKNHPLVSYGPLTIKYRVQGKIYGDEILLASNRECLLNDKQLSACIPIYRYFFKKNIANAMVLVYSIDTL